MKTETIAPVTDVPPPSPPKKVSPSRIRWLRRRRALVRFWAQFRTNKMGLAGLAILLFFVGMAVFSIFANPDRLDPTITTNGPVLASPSLLVGLTASLISMVLGSAVGVWSGYWGAFSDVVLMRVTEAFLVIPWLALAIVLAAVFGQNLWVIIFIIGLTSWAGTSRLVRAQVLSVKERTYIERSRALGGSDWHVVSRHVLPNVMPVIFANTILTIAIAILSESALSFLGLGDPLHVTWGTIIEDAFQHGALSLNRPMWLLAPSACIVLVVLGFTMVGFAMDEIVNPRIRQR